MIHKKFPTNPILPNCANNKSLLSMQQVAIKTKGGTEAIMWLSFAGSLMSSSAGLMTFAIPINMAVPHRDIEFAIMRAKM